MVYHDVYHFSIQMQSGAMPITSMTTLSLFAPQPTGASYAAWVK
jgi:hypothetical protein